MRVVGCMLKMFVLMRHVIQKFGDCWSRCSEKDEDDGHGTKKCFHKKESYRLISTFWKEIWCKDIKYWKKTQAMLLGSSVLPVSSCKHKSFFWCTPGCISALSKHAAVVQVNNMVNLVCYVSRCGSQRWTCCRALWQLVSRIHLVLQGGPRPGLNGQTCVQNTHPQPRGQTANLGTNCTGSIRGCVVSAAVMQPRPSQGMRCAE